MTPTTRIKLRWLVLGVMFGVGVGTLGTSWLMADRMKTEAGRWARVLAEAEHGPRVPPPPGRSGAGGRDGGTSRVAASRVWANSLPMSDEAWEAGRGVNDPESAVDWLKSLPKEAQQAAIQGSVRSLLTTDWEAGLSAVRQLPLEVRAAGLQAAAQMGARGPDQAESVMALLAESSATLSPDSESIAYAVRSFALWHDEAVKPWLESLAEGSIRDAAIKGYLTSGSAPEDRSEVAAWAASVGDHAIRASLIESALNEWHFMDPKAARAWVETTPWLTDDDRAPLRQRYAGE